MRPFFLIIFLSFSTGCFAQTSSAKSTSQPVRQLAFIPVKDQAATGTCRSFSMTSLIESQSLSAGIGQLDLSEMFTVRNINKEKAKNYILRQDAAQFGPGGLGHDVLKAINTISLIVPKAAFDARLKSRLGLQ